MKLKKCCVTTALLVSPWGLSAQEVFVKVVDATQLVAGAEYILACDYAPKAYVATMESSGKGVRGLATRIQNDSILLEDNGKVLRLHLKASVHQGQLAYQFKNEKNEFLRDGKSRLYMDKDSTESTTLYNYVTGGTAPYIGRPSAKNRKILFNKSTFVFYGDKKTTLPPELLLPCLFVKKDSPYAYMHKGGGSRLVLYAEENGVTLGMAGTNLSIVENVSLQNGVLYAGRRRDIVALDKVVVEDKLLLKNEKGEYLTIIDGALAFHADVQQGKPNWRLEEAGEKVQLMNVATSEVVTYRAGEGFVLTSNATEANVRVLEQSEVKNVTVQPVGYATYYTDASYVMPEGLKGSSVLRGTGRATIDMPYEYSAGSIVPPNTPLLLQSTTKNKVGLFPLLPTTKVGQTPTVGNLLRGTSTAGVIAEESGANLYYKLTYSNDGKNFGFFWGAEEGKPFAMPANRAYLVLSAETTPSPNGFFLDGDGVVGLHTVVAPPEKTSVTYDLWGRKVQPNAQGLYITNASKWLKR